MLRRTIESRPCGSFKAGFWKIAARRAAGTAALFTGLACLLSTAAFTGSARAGNLAIGDYSFEDPVLGPDGFSMAGCPSWTNLGPDGAQGNVYNGASGWYSNFPKFVDGNQLGLIDCTVGAGNPRGYKQTLGNNYQMGMSYTLTLAVATGTGSGLPDKTGGGNFVLELGYPDGKGGCISLQATTIPLGNLKDDALQEYTVTVPNPGKNAVGQPIVVVLRDDGVCKTGWYVFDNARVAEMNASPSPLRTTSWGAVKAGYH